MQDKHIAVRTFINHSCIWQLIQTRMRQFDQRIKLGWGKSAGPLQPALTLAVHARTMHNVYIGNIEDFETFSKERLKRDFGEYGHLELVNFLKEKNCAFVNFTNLSNAINVIEGANLRITHGKDRRANPPKSGPQGGGAMRRSASGNGHVPTGIMPSDDQELFQVPMDGAGIGIGDRPRWSGHLRTG